MRGLGRLVKADENGENERAVQMMHRLAVAKDWLRAGPLRRLLQQKRGIRTWPVVPGAYVLGDPLAPVAVCALTSPELLSPLAHLPGVAIAGRVVTPNLGIEHIIRNVTTNRALHFLLLCGKESPVFQPAQALRALLENGVTPDRRIIGAQGPLPILRNLSLEQIAAFRCQVELVDHTSTMDPTVLASLIQTLVQRNPGPIASAWEHNAQQPAESQQDQFKRLRPGGKRQPLSYDPKGFFVITLNRAGKEIIVSHYLPDQTPAHEMRGRSAESLVLGLLREDLISQMSHAGYLGAELAKAEAALRFGWHYEQDRPLRPSSGAPAEDTVAQATKQQEDRLAVTTDAALQGEGGTDQSLSPTS
jgi:tetrahydromethanopterin S-methyltransferase subunit A